MGLIHLTAKGAQDNSCLKCRSTIYQMGSSDEWTLVLAEATCEARS